jgi:hypothetical protein
MSPADYVRAKLFFNTPIVLLLIAIRTFVRYELRKPNGHTTPDDRKLLPALFAAFSGKVSGKQHSYARAGLAVSHQQLKTDSSI